MIRTLIFGTVLVIMILCYGCGTESHEPAPLGLCFHERGSEWYAEYGGCSIGLSAAECFESDGYEYQIVHGMDEVYCPW